MQAIWNNKVIAQSDNTLNIGGIYFFPRSSVHDEYLKSSDRDSQAKDHSRINYQDVEVDGNRLEGAAIRYTELDDTAKQRAASMNGLDSDSIDYSDYIGFTNGIQIKRSE